MRLASNKFVTAQEKDIVHVCSSRMYKYAHLKYEINVLLKCNLRSLSNVLSVYRMAMLVSLSQERP